MLPLWYFVDQLRILSKGLKILILGGFNNFHSWFIQEPRGRVSFALFFYVRDERGRSATASNGKKKIKAMQVWSLSGDTWSSRFSQRLIRYIFARKFAVNKILPVIYFANLEESSLTNSFWSKISLHVSRFHYPATMGLFCFSHARQPRKQNMCMLLAKAQEAILYMCLERRFGKYSDGQTLNKGKLH